MCKQQSYIAFLLLCIFWGIQLEKMIPHTHYTDNKHQLHVVFNESHHLQSHKSTHSYHSETLLNEEEAHGFHYTFHKYNYIPISYSHLNLFNITPINTVYLLTVHIETYNLLAKIRALSDGHYYCYSNNSPPIV